MVGCFAITGKIMGKFVRRLIPLRWILRVRFVTNRPEKGPLPCRTVARHRLNGGRMLGQVIVALVAARHRIPHHLAEHRR